ncbi:tRNA pseudouridine(13) synthase [hydrothermal vent metagenome]|uniref:tRNA pseudouridine(13) synthase n=1 Tax=hydrothermal vent metagenome TaxID=652676 RepID=A0A3B1DFL7_9ZZZZ
MTTTIDDSTTSSTLSLPHWSYLTKHIPGIGGVIKQQPEDFVVEEIPAYLPTEEGEHLFLWIEKRDVSAEDLLQHLAKSLRIRRRDIGAAGMKDRYAVTRQYLSVPAKSEEFLPHVETDAIHVLNASRHRNKLKTGHSRGNRFSLLIREPNEQAETTAQQLFEIFERQGFPNYFGNQRFGYNGKTYKLGFRLLKGEESIRDIPPRRRRFLSRLALSAAQSFLFNQMLDFRIGTEIFKSVILGDVMQVVQSGGLFTAEDLLIITEQFRFENHETIITGPMFGPKMKVAYGEPARWEDELLFSHKLDESSFEKYSRLTSGTRRPYAVHPKDVHIKTEPEGLRLEFTLPKGVYATSLLRELMKSE